MKDTTGFIRRSSPSGIIVGLLAFALGGCQQDTCAANEDCASNQECTNIGTCRDIVIRPPGPRVPPPRIPDSGMVIVDSGVDDNGNPVDSGGGMMPPPPDGGGMMPPRDGGMMPPVLDAGMTAFGALPSLGVLRSGSWAISSIGGTAENNVYAVGQDGTIMHFNGQRWALGDSRVAAGLADIHVQAVDNIWASGGEGRVVRYDGNSWIEPMRLGSVVTMLAVWSFSASDTWTAGASGAIAHYDGVQWTSHSAATSIRIADLWGDATTKEVWAANNGPVMRWDGNAWSTVMNGPTMTTSVHGFSSTDVWFHSLDGGSQIHRWDGSGFTAPINVPGACDGNRIRGQSPTDVWLVGGQTPCRFDGTNWTDLPTGEAFGAGRSVFDVYPVGANGAFAVVDNGILARFDGQRWTVLQGEPSLDRSKVWANSPTDVWMTNRQGTLHYDGSNWSVEMMQTPTRVAQDIWASPGGEVWVVDGSDRAMRRSNGSWSEVSIGMGVAANAVWGANPNSVWVAADGGGLYALTAGSFAASMSGTTRPLRDIHGAAPNDVWAVGDLGTILHYDGSAWSTSMSPSQANLTSVWSTAADNVWASGSTRTGGEVLRYDGTTWTVARMFSSPVAGVWSAGTDKVWVAESGANGAIWFFDGSTWTSVHDTGSVASDIGGANANSVFVPTGSRLEHYNGTYWAGWIGQSEFTMREVWALNTSEVWSVSDRAVHRYDGTRWYHFPLSVSGTMYAITGFAANDVWAVGDGGAVFRFDGMSWSRQTTNSNVDLFDVWGSGPNNVFAGGGSGGNAAVIRWDGTAWADTGMATGGMYVGTLEGRGGGPIALRNNELVQWTNSSWVNIVGEPMAAQYYGFTASDDGLWVHTTAGMFRQEGNMFVRETGSVDCCMWKMGSLGNGAVLALAGSRTFGGPNGRSFGLRYQRVGPNQWTKILGGPIMTDIYSKNVNELWIASEDGWIFDRR